ncbi:MAG: hypothetical protein HP491_08475 [Nitrospira sp.]|nr:hypothetical protein [Nitrospira sp.]MBH0181016.1 hypothetical protein [Nitrospira sp.]MBH0184953.1 hypothetical protein [Nitrospira sp.]MBH0188606.1 hypothetical protein [Nitrospira sp.]
MTFSERMLKIDRRIIFLVIGLCTLLPLLYPVGLPIKISSEVRGVYNHIESLPERSVFFLSFDFDPASKPELHPQAIALLRHAFRKNLRVVTMTLWVTGTGLADQIVTQVAKEMGKENGKDYVFLGWSPGNTAVIINLGQNLYNTFPSDYGGKPTKGLPVLDGVQSLKDVTYLVSLGAGNPGVEAWYVFGKDKYKFEMGGGCTGVMAPGLYPLLRSGQINGLIGGLRGAAEYESLIDQKGKAVAGMDAQSATHVAIIVLVIICNLFYFSMRRTARQQSQAS